MKRKYKLIKNKCEICGEDNKSTLELHHIIERTKEDTSNANWNLALVCSNCHNKIHAKEIKIIGVFPSTHQPNNRILVYEINGVKNIDI